MSAPERAKVSDGFARVRVLDAWDETPLHRALRLDLGGLHVHHRVPGQVLRLRPPGGEEGLYAIASAPAADRSAELLIKRQVGAADEVIARAAPGFELEACAPFGRGFPVAQARGRDVLLFAAGSGITPIRALLQHLLERRDEVGRLSLWYGQRSAREFAYAKERESWERAGLRVTLCCSAPDAGWTGERGRVHEVAGATLDEALARGAVAYLCGMAEMVEDVRGVLEPIGLPRERTFVNL